MEKVKTKTRLFKRRYQRGKFRSGLKNSDVVSALSDLKEKFVIICVKLCEKTKEIDNTLKNIEPKNDT